MKSRQLQILVSPGFLAGLCLLLLNDFVLKQQVHNGFTGKLSDFAGLFIFPLLLTALLPRFRSQIYVLTALFFVFWKCACSQALIEIWNSVSFFSIARTIDYTDFLALLVLPLSHAYSRLPSRAPSQRVALTCVALLSVFAFTATSFSRKTAYDNEYQFQISKADLIQRMRQLPAREVGLNFGASDTFEVIFDDCAARATVMLKENGTQSIIVLNEIENRCPGGGEKLEMLQYFEKHFINELKEERVTRSAEILDIWSKPSDYPQQATPQPPGTARPVKPPRGR